MQDASQADPPAWKSRRSYFLLWGLAALGVATDLTSKHLAFANLSSHPYPLIRGFLSLDRSINFGALFGIGGGMTRVFILASVAAVAFVGYMFATSRRSQWVVHIALALVLAGALGNLYDRLFIRAAVLIQDGREVGRGMLIEDHRPEYVKIDRIPGGSRQFPITYTMEGRNGQSNGRVLLRPTAVRDFIRVDTSINTRWTGPLPVWPWIFNVADSMLVIGVGLLLILYWRHPALAPKAQPQPAQASQSNENREGSDGQAHA